MSAPPPVSASAAPTATAIVPAELAAYIDGLVTAYRTKVGIAGVTVAVVDRDRVLFTRGYGQASFAPEQTVDPAKTLFRIGSVSKTFTYLAAMQLLEQGKLKLEDEANKYLPPKLQLPADGFPPVKVWHLLTHTAGYEDSALGHLFFDAADKVPALADYLARYRPQRVRAPEVHAVYSNYSVALLGALVAHVSGELFESYLEKHLLEPLGMVNTTFRELLPAKDPRRIGPALEKSFATGFERKAGGFEPKPFEFISACGPAGAGSSTAADMARYLRMLVNGGTLDGKSILQPATFTVMSKVNYRNADAVNGIAHGFFRQRYGRHESLEHGGATLYFHTAMVALPEAGFGVFVSVNTDEGREFAATLPRLIIERFVPDARPPTLPAPPADFAATAQKYAGSYLSERRTYSTAEKFLSALQPPTSVSVTKEGLLAITAGGNTKRFTPDGARVFRAVETGERVEFLADKSGSITGLASAYGHAVSDRVSFLGSGSSFLTAIGGALAASVAILLGLWRRLARRPEDRPPGGMIGATTLTVAAVAWLGFLIVLGVALGQLASGGNAVIFTYPSPALRLATQLGLGVAALSGLTLLGLPSAFLSSWSMWRKLRHLLFALVFIAASLALWQWNVILAPLMLGS